MKQTQLKGMKKTPAANNNAGGETMQETEFKIGEVTYEVTRVFSGEKSMGELIADRLVESYSENPTFDEGHT